MKTRDNFHLFWLLQSIKDTPKQKAVDLVDNFGSSAYRTALNGNLLYKDWGGYHLTIEGTNYYVEFLEKLSLTPQ